MRKIYNGTQEYTLEDVKNQVFENIQTLKNHLKEDLEDELDLWLELCDELDKLLDKLEELT